MRTPLVATRTSFIGLSVASLFRGKFADDCFLLVGFTIHPLLRHPTFACRVALSKSQHVPRLRLLPAVEFLSEAKAAFACRFFSLIPVRNSFARDDKKRRTPYKWTLTGFFFSGKVSSRRYVVSSIASIDTPRI